MLYDLVVKDPVTGDAVLIRVPFEIVSIQRADGIRFLSVSIHGGAFNLDGSTFFPPATDEGLA